MADNPMHARVLMAVQDCEAMCEHTITMVLGKPDVHLRVQQIHLLHDCADICTLTAKYIARLSTFAHHLAHMCAQICEACAAECMRFPDHESQHCAQVCMNCAQECRTFAGMAMPFTGMPGMYSQP